MIRCMQKLWGTGFATVLMSDGSDQEVAHKVRKAGFPLLGKPPSLHELLSVIEPGSGASGWRA
jgi:hypothetical protein